MGRFKNTLTLQMLKDQASQFDGKYDPTNPQREAFVGLYRKITVDASIPDLKKRHLLLGLLVYELEHIKRVEYGGKSPGKATFLGTKVRGSNLYFAIKELLGIKTDFLTKQKTYLDKDQRMIWLHELYKELESNKEKYKKFDAAKGYTAGYVQNTPDESLLVSVQSRLKNLRQRSDKDIKKLTECKPSNEALKQHIVKTRQDYHDTVQQRHFLKYWTTTSWNEKLLELVSFVNETCKDIYIEKPVQEASALTMAEVTSQDDASNARIAANLFVVLDIYNRYRLTSPDGTTFMGWKLKEGSVAFQKCLHNLSRVDLSRITKEERIALLGVLLTHLTKVEQHIQANDPRFQDILKRWEALGFKDVTKFKELVIDSLRYEKDIDMNSWSAYFLKSGVQAGLSVSAVGVLAKFGLPLLAGAAFANPLGFAAAIIGGVILTPIGTKAMGYLIEYPVGLASEAVTGATITAVGKAREGVQSLLTIPAESPDKIFDDQWKKMLLELPQTVLESRDYDAIADSLGETEVNRLRQVSPYYREEVYEPRVSVFDDEEPEAASSNAIARPV